MTLIGLGCSSVDDPTVDVSQPECRPILRRGSCAPVVATLRSSKMAETNREARPGPEQSTRVNRRDGRSWSSCD